MSNPAPILIVPAAGQGSRMKSERNKPYLLLAGKPVLAHTLGVFARLGFFSRIIPVIAPGEEKYFQSLIMMPFFNTEDYVFPVIGGDRRQASVYNALELLHREGIPGDTPICVHDGARPLVDEAIVRNVLEEVQISHAVITGVPVKDTIKMIDDSDNETVKSTLPRECLILTQTPQCFSFSILWEAHTRALEEGFEGSDDAVLVERIGITVKVVHGSYDNIKLTTPNDLNIAEALFSLKES